MAAKLKTKPVSGFCANKQCEGTKITSPAGRPMRSCDCWETCGCKCHTQITEMYKLAGMDREPPEQSPEYLAAIREQHAEFDMPRPWELPPLDGLSSPDGTVPLPTDEGPARGPLDRQDGPLSTGPHGTVEPRFTPTATGRRARGQLEYDVLKICNEYANDVYDWQFCTPKLVAERIGKLNDTEPPSTGAIDAVWDRWDRLGFAKRDRKPSRFVEFVIDGSAQTLTMLKGRVKHNKKRVKAEIKRGSLRPRVR